MKPRLMFDKDGRWICLDEHGKRAPLDTCVSHRVSDDGGVRVEVKAACAVDKNVEKGMQAGRTQFVVYDESPAPATTKPERPQRPAVKKKGRRR